ncbi:ABC transporter permease [Kineosporia succinea]|uniref:ABC transport system permease protein n=1 Tax=Kineosporia succinea TaxID=84632 RepID=A0ABT9PC13_9ACTN|nr:ABC transporter permease [Kineosporia succinea]MDP9830247.1 putative ABC transport system permease protein [Kineosporia succinea]
MSAAISLAVALVLLVAVAGGLGRWIGTGQPRAVLTATSRALVQLMVVGAVIAVVIRTPVLAPLYLLLMLGVASWTSARRIAPGREALAPAVLAIACGAGVSALIIFACRALEFDATTAVPFVAQLVGGSMTATTVAGQRFRDDTRAHWSEVEGWLALGATYRQALAELARTAAGRALVPALDQTRNVGLVTLPGAFVGLLLGGATPLEAGRVQLLVLVGLLAAETVAALVVTRMLSGRPGALTEALPRS